MIRKGQLRHRITVQRKDPEGGQNEYGEEAIVWVDDQKIFAAIYPLRGAEYQFAREQMSRLTHKIRAKFFKMADGSRAVPGNFRFKFVDPKTGATRFFDPQSPLVFEERNWYVDYMCVENV